MVNRSAKLRQKKIIESNAPIVRIGNIDVLAHRKRQAHTILSRYEILKLQSKTVKVYQHILLCLF